MRSTKRAAPTRFLTFAPALPGLCESSAIRGRCEASRLVKRRSERTHFTEADSQSDVRHRGRTFRQQCLGMFDATVVVISMRWHAERLLEGSAEVVRA